MRNRWRPARPPGAAVGVGSRPGAREVVMRLLRGEDLESVVAGGGDHGGAGVALAGSVSGCGAGGPKEPRDGCPGRRPSSAAGQDRRAADGDRVAVCEGGPAGGQRPFGPAEVDAMSGAQSISTRRAYGVQRVCRVWHAPAPACMRGVRRPRPRRRVVAAVRSAPPRMTSWWPTFVGCEASPFHGEGYRKVWAKLRVEGRRTSKERVRRLMREHDLQAPQRRVTRMGRRRRRDHHH